MHPAFYAPRISGLHYDLPSLTDISERKMIGPRQSTEALIVTLPPTPQRFLMPHALRIEVSFGAMQLISPNLAIVTFDSSVACGYRIV